jgi:rRNA maturation RNase YbeY
VQTNAQKYQTPFEEELRRVIIHGVLHLCGFHDKTEAEQQTMREAEDKALILI